jgi:hypothetical protein
VINFRYHVVSLAAVFLALAIGLVVGTAAANGPIADNLKDQVTQSRSEKQQLRDELDQARLENEKQQDFVIDTAPMTIGGKLAGKRVLVVCLEGNGQDVDKTVDGVVNFLGVAGAKVSGKVKLRDKFIAPASKDQLLDIADASAPPSISGALPNQNNAVDTSTALLAALLVGRAGSTAVEGTRTVLQAYESQGFLTADGDFTAPAEAVVLVAGAPTAGKDAKDKATATQVIVNRFELAGKLVVAGLSATGLVQAVRGDTALSKSVSTVDNAITAQGQVTTVLTLVDQLAGRVGHYGIGDGVTALLPRSAAQNGS